MRKTFFVVVAVLLCGTAGYAGEIRIGGSAAACKGFFYPVAEGFETEKGVKLKITPTNSAEGLIALNQGRIHVAASAASFGSMMEYAAIKGIAIDPALFRVAEIGANRTLAFTNRSNMVPALSREQLKALFTGKIRNWKEVGGDDRAVIVIWTTGTPGQNELFTNQVLDGAAVVDSATMATDYRTAIDLVIQTPGGIAMGPQGFSSFRTRNPQTPLIIYPVTVVTKGEPTADIQKLLSYIRENLPFL